MHEGHVVAPHAGPGLLVDEPDIVVAGRVERRLDVVGRDREVVDARAAVPQVAGDGPLVVERFEQFEVAVTGVEKEDLHPVELLLVGDGEPEQVRVQLGHRGRVVGCDAGVVEVHTRTDTSEGHEGTESGLAQWRRCSSRLSVFGHHLAHVLGGREQTCAFMGIACNITIMERNVGSTDRLVRLALGAVLLVAAAVVAAGVVSLGSGTVATVVVPLLLAVVGLVMLVTGYTQSCPAYALVGMRTLRRGQ